jgi:glycine/D-amino acid oxidase-like deaminating enzyme
LPHIAVIGAGSLGCAVACALSRRGARVTVYEARHPGAGTSTTSFAWVNSSNKQPRAYHDLNVIGMAAHRELQALSTTGPRWFHPTGRLEWAEEPEHAEDLAARVASLDAWGYRSRWITRKEARELEPDLRIPAAVSEVASFPDEGYVLPALLLGRLLGEARDRGAVVRAPAVVQTIEPGPHGARIGLEGGVVEEADVAVSCAGRWSTGLLASAGYRVPLADPDAAGAATVGFLAWTAPLVARLRGIVTAPSVTLRPDGGGRLVLQHLPLDPAADPARPPRSEDPVAGHLRDGLARTLVGGEFARIEQIRVGQRALPADGQTICGWLGERGHLYVIATHSGITLGPLLGRLAAQEILTDGLAGPLSTFRPDRFDAPVLPDLDAARRPGDQ